MKKKLIVILSLLVMFMTGCGNNNMTPTDKVEEVLGKYQAMDSEILTQLDSVISDDTSMDDDQKEDYRSLMEKQYQNLSYKIKDEEIDGDEATVLVEIEVFDYANSINESREYFTEHRDEFDDKEAEGTTEGNTNENTDGNKNENANGSTNENANGNANNNAATDSEGTTGDGDESGEIVGGAIDDLSSFITYKIEQLMNVTDKAKYEITFHLTKEDGEWVVSDMSDVDRQKIHGLFEG